MLAELIKFGVSLGSILALAGFAWMLKLGGDIRIRDARHAREIAQEHVFDFIPVAVALDRAGTDTRKVMTFRTALRAGYARRAAAGATGAFK